MEQGATIPGQRGKNIRDYLARTTNRLNLFAALFLAVLAVIPTLLTSSGALDLPFAASSILIAVSVSLETIRAIRAEGELSIRGIDSRPGDRWLHVRRPCAGHAPLSDYVSRCMACVLAGKNHRNTVSG